MKSINKKMPIKNPRKPEHKIDNLFINRYSPRALTGESIPRQELMKLFEAAKWAPSSFNAQPWRFLYATRESKEWPEFSDLPNEGNKVWCRNASALVVVTSRKNFEYKDMPNIAHSFDAGSAWENLALQATSMGFVAHAIVGFDYEKARKVLEIPERYDIEVMIAIGKHGNIENLPEHMRPGEIPNDRRKLKETVFEGKFPSE